MFHLFSINVTKVVGKLHFIIIQITDFYTYSSDEYGYLLFVYIHLDTNQDLIPDNLTTFYNRLPLEVIYSIHNGFRIGCIMGIHVIEH